MKNYTHRMYSPASVNNHIVYSPEIQGIYYTGTNSDEVADFLKLCFGKDYYMYDEYGEKLGAGKEECDDIYLEVAASEIHPASLLDTHYRDKYFCQDVDEPAELKISIGEFISVMDDKLLIFKDYHTIHIESGNRVRLKDVASNIEDWEIDRDKFMNFLFRRPKSPYDLASGDEYYYIGDGGEVFCDIWDDDNSECHQRRSNNLVYVNKDDAKNEALRMEFISGLKKNGGKDIRSNPPRRLKQICGITYDGYIQEVNLDIEDNIHEINEFIGGIYFNSYDDAYDAALKTGMNYYWGVDWAYFVKELFSYYTPEM